jgi:hypothetical protein
MNPAISTYNNNQPPGDMAICNLLATTIENELADATSKIWHAHPVWFLAGNPIVGYSKQKGGWRLMFWSGAGFDEEALPILGKKFKDASIFYNDVAEIDTEVLKRWLTKAKVIQWDYKNIAKRKGMLERLV